MKKLKYLLTIILLIVMLITLTACDSKEKEEDKDKDVMSYLSSKNNNSVNNENLENNNDNQEEDKGDNNMEISTTNKATEFLKQVKNLSSEQAVSNAEKQMSNPNEGDTIAIIDVENYGQITIKLFEKECPKACENFITHAKDGYYNGVIFHRVMENFMIQGGDPQGTGYGGESIWGKGFEEELNAGILPYRGSLCMASSGTGTSSLGSQFFITQAPFNETMKNYMKQYGISNLEEAYTQYGGDLADLVGYGQYTTFGQVIEGLEIVDKIAKVETNSKDKPLEDVVIKNIEITTYKAK